MRHIHVIGGVALLIAAAGCGPSELQRQTYTMLNEAGDVEETIELLNEANEKYEAQVTEVDCQARLRSLRAEGRLRETYVTVQEFDEALVQCARERVLKSNYITNGLRGPTKLPRVWQEEIEKDRENVAVMPDEELAAYRRTLSTRYNRLRPRYARSQVQRVQAQLPYSFDNEWSRLHRRYGNAWYAERQETAD